MLTQINNTILGVRNMSNTLAATAQRHSISKNSAILESIDPTYIQDNIENASGDMHNITDKIGDTNNVANKLESLILGETEHTHPSDLPSFLLLDADEKLLVSKPEQFLKQLKITDTNEKVKVVSIFGNTGEGKSHTLNQVFFKGNEVFKTSSDQKSCTLGVWAAYDKNLKVICLDTEGLLGITKKHSQRTRLLLKVLAVSDIVIYRTRAERLQSDMYTFLGGASKAYSDHFNGPLHQVWRQFESDPIPASLGPSVIIFHETKHTNTLDTCSNVVESAEDILRSRFSELNLDCSAFSSLKYVGIQTKTETCFTKLENVVHLELENTSVRSKRSPKIIFLTLKGLNDKFSSEIKNIPPQLHLKEYFTCQVKCQSCNEGCTLSMGHKEEGESHQNTARCKFQHQYQNCVYLCKQCFRNGKRVVVKPSYQSITEKSWSSYFSYVWSGYIIECKNCGEIYRSRQHWYGNKNPEDGAVLAEYVHVWPGERNFLGSNNSIQKVLDSVTYISDVVATVGSQPTQAVKTFITDKINPSYWKLDRDITECHRCKKKFPPTATKHHCRACGEGFCDKCSSKTQPVPSRGWREPVRVCDNCYQDSPPSLSHSVEDTEVTIRKYGETAISSITAVASALKIPTEMLKEHARPAYWTPDNECIVCECCKLTFDDERRLHHCRECGKGVCDDCSKNRKEAPFRGWDYPVRICKHCS